MRQARDRPRIGIEQGGADQLEMIGVDRHMVGDTVEPGTLDRDEAVAAAVGQLVEPFRQVGRRRAGHAPQHSSDASQERHLRLDPPPRGRVQESDVARQDVVRDPVAARPAVQGPQERAVGRHVDGRLSQAISQVHERLGRLPTPDGLGPFEELQGGVDLRQRRTRVRGGDHDQRGDVARIAALVFDVVAGEQ